MSSLYATSRSVTLRLVANQTVARSGGSSNAARSISSSAPILAAAAAAAAPRPAATPRRTAVASSTTGGARSGYARTSSAAGSAAGRKPSTPASRTMPSAAASKASPAAATASPGNVSAADIFDHFVDGEFPTPEPLADVPDYAALAPPPSRAASAARPAASKETAAAAAPRTFSAAAGAGGQAGDFRASESPIGFDESPPSPIAFDTPSTDSNGVGVGVGDWSNSFHGLSARPFDKEVAQVLMRPLKPSDVEIKPDGLLYLPEIKYRRTLNEAFGPGGWGLAPRSETTVGPRIVSREWALVCLGRLVAVARGEQEYFDPSGIPTAAEACKSNALMRCCKDLGIASELWDPSFIRSFKSKYCHEAFVEHATTKKKRKLWRKKEATFDYPYKEV